MKRGKEVFGELPDTESFAAIPGRGVEAKVKGKVVVLGTRKLMNEQKIAVDQMKARWASWRTKAKRPC